jgi:hypothetical protein
MQKTAARTKAAHKQAKFAHTEPRAFPEVATPVASRSSGRGPDGRFAAGNRGGPGNPNARHCARMLDLFRTCISDEDMVHLYRVLYDKAMKGDVSAAKLVLAYKIGKPAPCPDPDAIDRDEWDHYQQDAIEPEKVRQVLGSLPTCVGNDIARTVLPIMTEARTRDLATQLHGGCPVSPEAQAPVMDAREKDKNAAPLPNRFSGNANPPSHASPDRVEHEPSGRETANRAPIRNGKHERARTRVSPGAASRKGSHETCYPSSLPHLGDLPTGRRHKQRRQ